MKSKIKVTYSRSTGISILEILISIAVLSIVIISAFPTITTLFRQVDHIGGIQMCRSRLQSQMSLIKDRGATPIIKDYKLDINGLPIEAGTGQPLVDNSSGQWVSKTSVLIQDGSFSEILKDYLLHKADYAGALGKEIPVLDPMGNPIVENLNSEFRDFKLYKRIQPYNIFDEGDPNPVPATCPKFSVKPFSVHNDAGGNVRDPANNLVSEFEPCTLNNVGFIVTLTGKYKQRVEESAKTFVDRSCELETRFSLPIDNEPEQVSPTFSVGVINGVLDINKPYNFSTNPNFYSGSTIRDVSEARPLCSAGDSNVETATFRVQIKDVAPGSVPFCRDDSDRYLTKTWCEGDPGAKAVPPPGKDGKWVPCSQLKACGQSNKGVVANVVNKPNGRRDYTFDITFGTGGGYTMAGCDVKFSGAVMDVGGNLSVIQNTSTSGYSYYAPAKCWSCYKKKKSWSSVIKGAVMTGLGVVLAPVPVVGFGLMTAGAGLMTGGLLCMAGASSQVQAIGAGAAGGAFGVVANKNAGGCSGGAGGAGNSCKIKGGKGMVCNPVPIPLPPKLGGSLAQCDLSVEAPATFSELSASIPYTSTLNPMSGKAYENEEAVARIDVIPNDIKIDFVDPLSPGTVTGNMTFPKDAVFCEARKVCVNNGGSYNLQPLSFINPDPDLVGEGEPECFVRLAAIPNNNPGSSPTCSDSISLGALSRNGGLFSPMAAPTAYPHITTTPSVTDVQYQSQHSCPASSGVSPRLFSCFDLAKYAADSEAYLVWKKYDLMSYYKPVDQATFSALPACNDPDFPAPDQVNPATEICGTCNPH